ncbi:MAG: hypothetical protein CM15mP111_2190 [Hyphomicrobiales bacterium]|nr:MAG: hypothetical protein CM15mP111_2190 [Hyphomicrobiales bacterium]
MVNKKNQNKMVVNRIEQKMIKKGLRMTEQRKVIAKSSSSHDHPDAEELYKGSNAINNSISLAQYIVHLNSLTITVY